MSNDIYIDNLAFKLRSLNRGTTNDQVARFGSPEKGETNLDLLKAKTQKSFRGGMFQRTWTDDEMASSITNGYYNKLDDSLYVTPDFKRVVEATGINASSITAWCFFRNATTDQYYIAYRLEAPGTTNVMVAVNPDTLAVTSITLPSTLQGSHGCPITSMVVHGNAIFIDGLVKTNGTSAGMYLHRYDGQTTFTQITTSYQYCKLASLNQKLYGIGYSQLYLITSEFTGTIGTTLITDNIGGSYSTNDDKGFAVYNGAIYIAKSDGLWRFDGVATTNVFDYTRNRDVRNFEYLAVFNGRLYFNLGAKVMEFDGTTLTELQDLSEGFTITDIQAGTDRLWIACRLNGNVPGNDKAGSLTNYEYTIFCYNGVGFFEYSELPDTNSVSYLGALKLIPADFKLLAVLPNIYLNGSSEPRSDGYWMYRFDLVKEFTTDSTEDVVTDRTMVVTSSEFDGGYANVDKVLNGIQIDYRGLDLDFTNVFVEEQHLIDGVWSSWSTIWDSQYLVIDGFTNDYYIYEQIKEAVATEPIIFEKIRYRLTATIMGGSTTEVFRVRSVTLRYTIAPRLRLQWGATLALYNNIDNGAYVDAKEARKRLYDAYKNKLPVLLYDVEYSTVSGYNAGTNELQVLSDNWLSDGDTVAINTGDQWINRRIVEHIVDGVTVLGLASFGSREGIGGSEFETSEIDEGMQIRKSYPVQVSNIQNERIILDENTLGEDQGTTNLESELMVELIEV